MKHKTTALPTCSRQLLFLNCSSRPLPVVQAVEEVEAEVGTSPGSRRRVSYRPQYTQGHSSLILRTAYGPWKKACLSCQRTRLVTGRRRPYPASIVSALPTGPLSLCIASPSSSSYPSKPARSRTVVCSLRGLGMHCGSRFDPKRSAMIVMLLLHCPRSTECQNEAVMQGCIRLSYLAFKIDRRGAYEVTLVVRLLQRRRSFVSHHSRTGLLRCLAGS